MGKIEEKKENKRASLLQTAFDLFLDQGFAKTTISDIVQRAGLAKGTFYLYFKDKYDLRDQLVARKTAQLLSEAQAAARKKCPDESFEPMLTEMVDYILEYLEKNHLLLKFITKNLSWGLFKYSLQQSDSITASPIYDGYLRGLNREGLTCDQPELMLYTIMELVGSTAYHCILYQSPVDMETYRPYLHTCIHQIILAFTKTPAAP